VAARNESIFREWLTQYGPLAGFWFDTDSAFYKDKNKYPRLAETFGLIRSLQPQALISFCHGVTGDEDYITYEHHFHPQSEFKFVPAEVQQGLRGKTVEIATTLQLDEKGGRGTKMWFNVDDAYHRNSDDVWQILAEVRRDKCNLLLNTGLLGDGSIHAADAATLREVGKRLHDRGWPGLTSARPIGNEGEDR
jgi:alpha-L-fucosidase